MHFVDHIKVLPKLIKLPNPNTVDGQDTNAVEFFSSQSEVVTGLVVQLVCTNTGGNIPIREICFVWK